MTTLATVPETVPRWLGRTLLAAAGSRALLVDVRPRAAVEDRGHIGVAGVLWLFRRTLFGVRETVA